MEYIGGEQRQHHIEIDPEQREEQNGRLRMEILKLRSATIKVDPNENKDAFLWNRELYEAAEIDGAGRWTKFWDVTWPQLAPTTFFIVVLSLIASICLPYTVQGGNVSQVVPLLLSGE